MVNAQKIKEYIIPIMKQAPVIDGNFTEKEWNNAAGFDGISWNGKLEERNARGYIGATEKAFYFAIVSELPPEGKIKSKIKRNNDSIVHDDAVEVFIDPNPEATSGIRYQVLVNALGYRAYLCATRGNTKKPSNWTGNYIIKNGFSNGKWITEFMVPIAGIVKNRKTTDGVWGLSICRDWKQPWQFSSMPGNFAGSDTKFKFVKNAPAIQFKQLGDFHNKKILGELTIKNTANKAITLDVLMNVDLDVMPSVRKAEKVTIKAGKTVKLPYNACQNAANCEKFNFSVKVSNGKQIYYCSNYKWDKKRKARWSTIIEKALPFDFEFAYYPYRNLLRVRNLFQNYKKKLPAQVTYTITKKNSKKIIKRFKANSKSKSELDLTLPPLDGEYILTLQLGDKKLSKSFTRKRYNWENNKLGLSRKVHPPFTEIQVKNKTISTVFRDYKIGDNGLPEQINIRGIDILAAPVALKVNGRKVQAGSFRFIEKSGDIVRTENKFESKKFSALAKGRWEYDGCLKYDLTINPSKNKVINSMILEIPLKDKYAPMYHAIGDGMRNSLFGYLEKGNGEIWNSKAVKVNYMPENFCSYLFVGSPLRGLSFFAENDKNWSWDRKKPNMRILRKGKQLIIEINLINKPTIIRKAQTLSFGLQAAPVKPRLKGWRHFWIKKKFSLLGTCINWLGGPGNCSNVYPLGRDEYFWSMIAKGNVEKVPKKEIDECVQRGFKYYKPFDNYKKSKESWKRHVYYNVGGSRYKKSMVFYYNRAVFNALDEYSTFINEWIRPDFPSRTYVLRKNEIKVIPSKSYNDFAVHWYARSIEYRNQGIYWDNWFLCPSYNTEMTDAYYNADGSITPATGMWQLRALAKRTFQMMNEKGVLPITFPHMTSTSILPMLSFATVQYDWEWKYSTGDIQYRYSRPYTTLVSNGELAGCIPVMLHEHGKQSNDEWVQRTFAGVCLVHELISYGQGKVWKTLRDPLLNEYLDKADVKVLRYWDKQNTVKVNDKDYAWILYSLPGKKAVLIICSYKESAGELSLSLDLKKLGLKPNAYCSNYETRENIKHNNSKLILKVKKHELIAIEFSNQKQEKRIMKITLKKPVKHAIAAAFIVVANSAVGMDIAGVDDGLKENIIYYNSFSSPKKHDVSKIKLKYHQVPKKYDKETGISGGSAVITPKDAVIFKSKELGMQNNRTISYWFMIQNEIPVNKGGGFFSLSGRPDNSKTTNFISAFVRGGPWCALKDSALVIQMYSFKNIANYNKIVDRKFRANYPAGKWHLFTITSNGKNITAYIDGKMVSNMTAARVLNDDDNLSKMEIAYRWSVPVLIDDLIIFDLALTADQIKNYYDANQAMLARKEIK